MKFHRCSMECAGRAQRRRRFGSPGQFRQCQNGAPKALEVAKSNFPVTLPGVVLLAPRAASLYPEINYGNCYEQLCRWSWKGEVESGAFIGGAFRPDPAAVAMDDSLHGCQADACAGEFIFGMQPLERAE